MANKVDGRTTDTKKRILREAKRMYLKGGYAGISLQELATRLEISKPALFHHYKSKQELFYEILLDIAEGNRLVIHSAIQQGRDSRSRLHHILLTMRHQPFFDPMKFLNEEMDELNEEQRRDVWQTFYESLQGPITQVLEEGIMTGELRPHNTRVGEMAFVNLLMLLPSPGSPISRVMAQVDENEEEYIEELLRLFVDGLRN
ncbi:MAG: TetR/AcrR family transcriptional regulator [Chloroflexota bacterium]|nr:TetR/AcrR family transcriptional regulator [Chloroflexota bacterium]